MYYLVGKYTISSSHFSPQSTATFRGNLNLYIDQPITKGRCQPFEDHVSDTSDSPDVTVLDCVTV